MIGIGLMVGSFFVERVIWFVTAFLVTSCLGLFVASSALDLDKAMYGVAFAACAHAALTPGKFAPLGLVVAVIGGMLIGSASLPDAGPMRDRIFTMSGSIVGANLGLLYLWGIIHFVKQRFEWAWIGIGFRVASAWLAAISLLMLALGFATVPPVL